jgi:hypothetical protein
MTESHHSSGLDERDQALVAQRLAARESLPGPQVGDFVQFAQGPRRRVSYVCPESVQTSDEGRYYLCESGACDFSGPLYRPVPLATLTPTAEHLAGSAWIFHHDRVWDHNGVEFQTDFELYTCSAPPPAS